MSNQCVNRVQNLLFIFVLIKFLTKQKKEKYCLGKEWNIIEIVINCMHACMHTYVLKCRYSNKINVEECNYGIQPTLLSYNSQKKYLVK